MHMSFFRAYVIEIAQYGIIHMPLHIRLSHIIDHLQRTYRNNRYHRGQYDVPCPEESNVAMAGRHWASA